MSHIDPFAVNLLCLILGAAIGHWARGDGASAGPHGGGWIALGVAAIVLFVIVGSGFAIAALFV